MCLKNKIISGLLVLALAAAIVPATTKAATPTLDELQAQVQALTQQIAQLVQLIASIKGTTTSTASQPAATSDSSWSGHAATQTGSSQYVPSNSPGATYTSSTYQNPSDCPAPSARSGCSSPYTAWAKKESNGVCCQYASTCDAPDTGNWTIYSTQEGCQAGKTACTINGDSCCQNGKCYPLTNTCTNGATPFIRLCANYGSYCTPIIGCSAGETVVAANCNQECQKRGFAGGDCTFGAIDAKFNATPYDKYENIIGKTTDCMGPEQYAGYYFTHGQYCGCNLAREDNVPFGQPNWLGMNSMCESVCKSKGFTFGDCHMIANSTNMVCTGNNQNYYAGTTNVCKPGPNWTAGCCCQNVGFFPGASTPGPSGPSSAPSTGTVANGQSCKADSDCSSGVCNYTYCVPDATNCGGVKDPMYFANGATASNQWFGGVCRNGVWKTTLNNIGCDPKGINLACDSGTCVNNTCVANGSSGKANGQQCSSGSQCSSGYCNCGYCVPGSTYCGSGLPPNNYVASGEKANYGTNYFNGVCNNGAWNIVGGGYGCTVTNSACSPSTLACASGYTCNTGVANGKCQ